MSFKQLLVLLAKVYKGRYFSSLSFLKCGKGYRPSYAWRSILFGREFLRKGLIKSIGDGKDTFVWSDKWILDDVPRRPVSKQISFDVALRVSEVIGEDGKWRIEKLQDLFPPNEVQRIKQIIIGDVEDREVWAFNKTENYSVKSGCWLLAKLNEDLGGPEVVQGQAVIYLKNEYGKSPRSRKFVCSCGVRHQEPLR